MNIINIFNQFKAQEDCLIYLEKVRWNNKPKCPYCNSVKSTKMSGNRHHCNKCNTSYSVTVGTIFHQTHLPLQKWFLAISLMLNAKKGLPSRQLARDIKVNPNTACRMQMQIRKAMIETPSLMSGICEMGENYIGGKPRNSDKNKDDDNLPKIKRGRGTKKTPVVGVVERGGNVNAKVLKRLKFKDSRSIARDNIDFNNTVLMTDDYRGYIPLNKLLPHGVINHSRKQYVKGNIHTNTTEGLWPLLKRGIVGQYHYLSDKYLNRYIQEFCFK